MTMMKNRTIEIFVTGDGFEALENFINERINKIKTLRNVADNEFQTLKNIIANEAKIEELTDLLNDLLTYKDKK